MIKIDCITDKVSQHQVDLYVIMGLFSIVGFGSFLLANQLDSVLMTWRGLDFWFQSDSARVVLNMSDPTSDHSRAAIHPIFSLLTTPFVLSLSRIFDIEKFTAVKITISLSASLWISLLYVLLRLLGLLRFDAVLFSCLAAVSSASIFWFCIPETFSLGSLSIVFALVLLVRTKTGTPGEIAFTLASIATLSFTVTNWMFGLLATFIGLPFKKFVRVNVIALLVVSFFSYIQRYFFTYIPFFIGRTEDGRVSSTDEVRYLFMEETGGPLRILISFLFHTIVMPGIEYADKMNRAGWKILSVQHSLPWSGNFIGTVAWLSWSLILGIGFWSMYRLNLDENNSQDKRICQGFILAFLGQLGLHLLYGDETFLYSLHFLPLLIIIAAYGTLSRLRKVVLALAIIVFTGAAVNNFMQFRWAVDTVNTHF